MRFQRGKITNMSVKFFLSSEKKNNIVRLYYKSTEENFNTRALNIKVHTWTKIKKRITLKYSIIQE